MTSKTSKITYHQQVSYCGKPRCRKCREGTGHGPYWYAYKTVDGRTTRSYVGKSLPPDALVTMDGAPPVLQSPLVSAQEQATVRIYALGQFRLERRAGHGASEWQTVTDAAWQHQRVRALLSCLVSYSGSGARQLGREQIMDALWPDLDIDNSASRLDRAVYSLRQLFEPNRTRPATSPLLLTERELVMLADQSQVWIDADAFEHLLAKARASKEADPREAEHLLEEAAKLYAGDFLPEEHNIEWTLARRESLTQSWISALLTLSDLRVDREALSSAIDPLDKLLTIDPTNEAAVQRLIRLLKRLGRRGEALRAYKRLVAALLAEYGIAPLPETRALYEALRSGSDTTTRTAVGDPATSQRERRAEPTFSAPAIQIGRSHQNPLVGRETELQHLIEMLTTTEQRARFRLAAQKKTVTSAFDTERLPQCMLLMGEVGIGKTRLAEEVSREAKRRKWAVAWGRVYAQETNISYRLWTEVLRKAMEQGAWQRQELSRRPLVFQPLCALLPELKAYIQPINSPSSQSPQQEQLRLWEAIRELILLISESAPLLITLDDLQWADRSSCELLAYLSRRIYGHPIIIIATCRDHELPDTHALKPLLTDLLRERAVETIALHALSNKQIGTLVSHSLHVEQVPEPLVESISTRAAGNPFFAEELARTIDIQLSTQDANGTNGHRPTNGHTPTTTSNNTNTVDESILPDTISAVLDLRLGRLSDACARLLTKAAVLGGSFEFRVITEMEANRPDYDEDVVLELLEEALHEGMLTEEGTGVRITYQFWHPLLQSHLYDKLSAARRANLHRRAADIFKLMYEGREEDGAATITHHLIRGGAAKATIAHFAELAGNKAYQLSSYPDAGTYYRIAMEHLGTSDELQEHIAYLCEFLGECTHVQGKREEARHFYEQALEIHKRTSPDSLNAAEKAQLQALLLCEIGVLWRATGNPTQARQCYQQGEQVLHDASIKESYAWARIRFEQGHVYATEGNYEDARHLVNEALKAFEKIIEHNERNSQTSSPSTHIRRTLSGDPTDLGRAHWLLGIIAGFGGQSRESLMHLKVALTLYERHNYLRYIAIASTDLGDLYLRTSQYTLAQAAFRRSLHIAERIGHQTLMCLAHGNLGEIDLRFGNLSEAEFGLRKSITLAEHINDLAASLWYSDLATALLEQGRLVDACAPIHCALKLSRASHTLPYIGIALVAMGGLRVTQAIATNFTSEMSSGPVHNATPLLRRAKKTLQHALNREGLFAETKTEGQLILAQVNWLLSDLDLAYQQATQALEEARQSESMRLVARAQRILGGILAAQHQPIKAIEYFDQALKIFRKCGMRLEEARTLQAYGEMLVQESERAGKDYQRGMEYLQEARKVFVNCKAELDVKLVERVLERCGATVQA